MKTRALTAGTALDMSRPERDAEGPLDLIRKGAERPPLVGKRSSWRVASPSSGGRQMNGDRYPVGGLKVND